MRVVLKQRLMICHDGLTDFERGVAMKRFLALCIVVVFSMMSSGCAVYTRSLNDAERAQGKGVTHSYKKSYDTVWKVVTDVVNGSSLSVVSSSRTNGKILAIGEQTPFSYGEFVAIYVEDIDGRSSTKVEVISLSKFSNNITATDWAEKLLPEIDNRLR